MRPEEFHKLIADHCLREKQDETGRTWHIDKFALMSLSEVRIKAFGMLSMKLNTYMARSNAPKIVVAGKGLGGGCLANGLASTWSCDCLVISQEKIAEESLSM